MTWKVELLDETVEAELMSLPADMQARFLHIAELLETFGPQRVGMPHIRPLERKLWEMRLSGKAGIARGIYIAVQAKRLVVLHFFIKKTQKTPRKALEIAYARMKEL